jgi:GT2 family glycosyltransferase
LGTPEISIVIPCKNEGINIFNTVSSILEAPTDLTFEVLVIDDGSTDGCCRFLQEKVWRQKVHLINSGGVGACRARNQGAYSAQAEYLLFCDAHIFVQPFWLDHLVECFTGPEIGIVSPAITSSSDKHAVGYGMTLTEDFGVRWLPHPDGISSALIAPGGCAMVKRSVFLQLGGFDEGLRIWGHEDVELSLRYWLLGYRVLINPNVEVAHIFRKSHPYQVSMDHIYYNYLRIGLSHFNAERIKKILRLIKPHPQMEEILCKIMLSDIWNRRKKLLSIRRLDDDTLFNMFKVPF